MAQLLPGLPDVSTYAPRARVEVEGQELDPRSMGDLLSVSVVLEADALASFSLTVNNWEATALAFKYSDDRLFDVGHSVHVQLGYADRVVSMVRGIITSLTPRFPDAGPPTIGVSGQDSLILLRDRKPTGTETRKFTNKTDGEIAEVVALRNGLTPRVDKTGERHPEVYQRDLDDLRFLMERAKRIDFDCYIANDPEGGRDELHFEKPTDGRDARAGRVYQFEWGRNLMSFNPQITISRQVAEVTVRGWDPKTKTAIVGQADLSSLPPRKGPGASGPAIARDRLRDKRDVVVDAPVHSKREADDLARALLLKRAYDFVTASGQCVGQPEMRPGDNLVISGLGRRFDGEYYVKKTTHTFGSSGYVTEFDVRRVYDGGLQ
jgi:Bacteriophage probable baseplate hub protein